MAWIRSLNIAGLAGRKKPIRLDLNRETNVIWGLNGSGKTSLLKILHSALLDETAPLLSVPFASAEVTFYSADSDSYITRTISKPRGERDAPPLRRDVEPELFAADDALLFEERSEVVKAARRAAYDVLRERDIDGWRWEVTKGKIVRSGRYRHSYLPISRLTSVATGRTGSARRVQATDTQYDYDKLFASHILSLWDRMCRQILERLSAIQRQGLASVFNSVIQFSGDHSKLSQSGAEAGDAYRSVSNFFRSQGISVRVPRTEFIKSFRSSSVLPRVVSEITEVERQLDEAMQPMRTIEAILKDLFQGRKTVHLSLSGLEVRMGDMFMPVESLSSGEKQIILILLETLAAGQSVVMVDEPEVSMHVDWQHRIVDAMKTVNPVAQIIVATHSPEVLAGVPDASITEL